MVTSSYRYHNDNYSDTDSDLDYFNDNNVSGFKQVDSYDFLNDSDIKNNQGISSLQF